MEHKLFKLADFPLKSFDKIRYSDTDRQGHVNNSVFSSFLETGRVEILYNKSIPLLSENCSFVIASLALDFLQEITWPGQVEIGTGILKIGNSSIRILQMLYQNDLPVARSETVIVHIQDESSKSYPLSEDAKNILKRWLINL
ncbi:MAG: acyl-CoA thioesterase [Calditrichaeota bacterium]|nr:acyl-CoA thioesterase [Calditrichota bacterium]